jgi:5-methyltetrahydrofolate--homocysteine methyltransferase
MDRLNDLYEAVISFKEDEAKKLVEKYIDEGTKPENILVSLQTGLIEIGNRFEREECFTPELMYGAEIVRTSIEPLKPLLKGKTMATKGKVILGTVFGDIHNIGKDLVKLLLEGDGFEVIDLGENVDPSKFVEAIKSSDSKLVGLSALLTMSFDAISEAVKAINDAGYKDKVKIMVGGAPVTELVREKSGADFYGEDAFSGVKYAREVYGY